MNHDMPLTGSKADRGRPTYTATVDQNLFTPLSSEVRQQFMDGDGAELRSEDPRYPFKMQAVHSSSALGVNVFQYWRQRDEISTIAAACGLCRPGSSFSGQMVFEEKFVIDSSFKHAPNLDIVMRRNDGGLRDPYLHLPGVWDDIPNLRRLAQSVSPSDLEFTHLHPAQLIKHILGLKRDAGIAGFRLLYLWYDTLGVAGATHRREVELFASIAKSDGIHFHAMTHQELIVRLAVQLRSQHSDYVRYLSERYL